MIENQCDKAQDNGQAEKLVISSRGEFGPNFSSTWDKVKYFYQAPVVKFAHHLIFYSIFLLLLAYTLISRFQEELIEWNEIALSVIMFGLIVQEIRQVISCILYIYLVIIENINDNNVKHLKTKMISIDHNFSRSK